MQTATFILGKLLMLSGFCLSIADAYARTTFYDTGSSNDLLSWLRDSKPIVLSEDVHQEDESFGNLASLQNERPFTRTDRSLLPEYRHLCETTTRKVELSNDPNYEYQPPHYFEIFCKSYSLVDAAESSPSSSSSSSMHKSEPVIKQKCAHPSFHCIQRTRTLFMLRRRWDGECWEPATKVVASGCDCMWPTANLGDVSMHY